MIKKIIMILAASVMLMSPTFLVLAKDNDESKVDDWVTTSYIVEAVADNSYNIHITETIDVYFAQDHHGIVRYIPISTDKTYSIRNIKVTGDDADIETDSYNVTVRIGDADTYVNGEKEYTISYDVVGFKDDSEKNDYLALNLLPTDWESEIWYAGVSLTLPEKIDWGDVEIYSGSYGKNDELSDYFVYNTDGNTIVFEGTNIPAHHGLTVRDTNLPDGYWAEAVTYQSTQVSKYIILAVFTLILLAVSLIFYIRRGRPMKLVKPVEFYPPDNMTPLEIGYAIDGSVETEEVMMMVMYFADKGYLKIREVKKDKFELEKVQNIDRDNEKAATIELFDALFKERDTLKLYSLPTSLYSKVEKVKTSVEENYRRDFEDVFTGESEVARWVIGILIGILPFFYIIAAMWDPTDISGGIIVGIVGGAILAVISWFGVSKIAFAYDHRYSGQGKGKLVFGVILAIINTAILFFICTRALTWYNAIIFIITEVLLNLFYVFTPARSRQSADRMGRILGFKNFIKTAEYDRLVTLSNEDPEYYYKILPYASVLGLDTVWTKKFKDIRIPQPIWYDPYDTNAVFTTMMFLSFTRSTLRAPLPQPQSTSSGGSSGFSGGFSGGGFGGGGGGAW